MLSRILLIVAACGLLFAQPNELNLRQDPPAAIQSNQVNAVYTGTAGGTTYYYWVVTRYPIGYAVPVSPVAVARAASSLGGGNSIALTWPAMAGASSYDVLRTSTPAAPSSCTCAVTLATTSTTLTDNGGGLSAWPPNGLHAAGSATMVLQINNRDGGAPYIEMAVQNAQRALNYQLGLLKNGPAPAYVPSGFIQTYANQYGRLACVDSSGADCLGEIIDVTNFGAKGDGSTDDTAAIQSAVNAAQPGNTVFLPKRGAGYLLRGSGSQLVLVTKSLHFACESWETPLLVDSSVGASTDVLHIKPTTYMMDLRIEGCQITSSSGTPARHAIHIESAGIPIHASSVTNNRVYRIGGIGGKSLFLNNSTGGIDGIFGLTVTGNHFGAGILVTAGGDSLQFQNNTVFGTGPAFDIDLVQGSSKLSITENNATASNGFAIVRRGTRCLIANNNIEPSAPRPINDAIIDLIGSAGDPISNAVVADNFFSSTPGSATYMVRLDYTVGAAIQNNVFGFGDITQRAVTTTTNSVDTYMQNNRNDPYATTLNSSLVDNSASTVAWLNKDGYLRFGEYPTLRSAMSIKGIPGQAQNILQVGCRTSPFDDSCLFFQIGPSGIVTAKDSSSRGVTEVFLDAGANQSGAPILAVRDNAGVTRLGVSETALQMRGSTGPQLSAVSLGGINTTMGSVDGSGAFVGTFSNAPLDLYANSDVAGRVHTRKAITIGGNADSGVAKIQTIGGGLQLGTASRPTCDATARGTLWYVAGGAGVSDTFEVCSKDAADAYAWRSVY